MTFAYKRSNFKAFLMGDGEFLSYLPSYCSYWKEHKASNLNGRPYSRFDVSFLEAGKLKIFLLEREVNLETFSGVFYALTLFSQVVHYYRSFIWDGFPNYREQSDQYQIFQTVNGVLSTAYAHVCPAVMPSMILYLDPDWNSEEVLPQGGLENALWAEHADIFDRGVQLVLENVDYLIYALLIGGSSNEKLRRIYFNEHAGLRSKILSKNNQGRVISHAID